MVIILLKVWFVDKRMQFDAKVEEKLKQGSCNQPIQIKRT